MKLCTVCEKCLYACPKDPIKISDISLASEVSHEAASNKFRTKYDVIIGSCSGFSYSSVLTRFAPFQHGVWGSAKVSLQGYLLLYLQAFMAVFLSMFKLLAISL